MRTEYNYQYPAQHLNFLPEKVGKSTQRHDINRNNEC